MHENDQCQGLSQICIGAYGVFSRLIGHYEQAMVAAFGCLELSEPLRAHYDLINLEAANWRSALKAHRSGLISIAPDDWLLLGFGNDTPILDEELEAIQANHNHLIHSITRGQDVTRNDDVLLPVLQHHKLLHQSLYWHTGRLLADVRGVLH